MNAASILDEYVQIFRQRFPSVIVEIAREDKDQLEDVDLVFRVFRIPDELLKEYTRFVVMDLPDLLEQRGLPRLTLIPFSETATRQYYPKVIAEQPVLTKSVWSNLPEKASSFFQVAEDMVPYGEFPSEIINVTAAEDFLAIYGPCNSTEVVLKYCEPDVSLLGCEAYWLQNQQLSQVLNFSQKPLGSSDQRFSENSLFSEAA